MLCKEKIQRWLEARGYSIPEEANCGECENFAQDFQGDIPGSELYGAEEFDGPDTEWGGHIWLYDGNLHYDSESPEGVVDWMDLKFYRRMKTRRAFETLKKALESSPPISRTVTVRMPGPRDESSSIIRSTCDGIYPIRQGIHMKKQKPTIVKVSSRKIDSREPEARELVEWLKTIPTSNFDDPLVPAIVLYRPGIDAVERLTLISWEHLDHKVGSGFDFLRFFGDRGMKRYGVVYMEYCASSDNDDEHYETLTTQDFHHVVDAVKAFKLRLESDNPARVVKV